MNAQEQLKEVQTVLDKLTRFRHFNGWAAIAAGIMGIAGFIFITFIANFPVIIPDHFLWMKKETILTLVLSFAGLMIITGLLCAGIIVFSLPKNLTIHGWNNLKKLVGTLALYIFAGIAIAWSLLSKMDPTPAMVMFMPAMMCLLYGLSLLHIAQFSEPILKKLGLFIFICGLGGILFAPYSWILWLVAFGFGQLITGFLLIRNKNFG